MVDEEDVGLLPEKLGREMETALEASLALLDSEEVSAVEGFGG